MRIGILTFYESMNYGTVLQAYALQKYLNDVGHTAELVHIKRNVNTSSRHFEVQETHYGLIDRVKIKARSLNIEKSEKEKNNRFKNFQSMYLRISPVYYESDVQLHSNPPVYDLYLSGGDQIWNPYHKVFLTHYMWDFVPDGAKIASYSSSFGVSHIDDTAILENMQRWLQRYHTICVREKSGVDIVKQMGLEASQVLDPVFLIRDQWKEFIDSQSTGKKYCLVYALIDYPKEEDQFIKRYAKEHGLEIKIIPYNRRNCIHNYVGEFDAGPIEFLNLVANAEMIFTNSFHGMAFSLIFNKQFYLLSSVSTEGKSKRDRLTDLMRQLDIEETFSFEYSIISHKMDSLIEKSKGNIEGICKKTLYTK